MSDSLTPRTDERIRLTEIGSEDSCAIYVYIAGNNYQGHLIDADFCRTIETELLAANERAEAYKKVAENLVRYGTASPAFVFESHYKIAIETLNQLKKEIK